ncbi:MAG: hypothetical protein HYT69_01745 [Candidatus Zambryskibacteria bacterium]|nr:hypothetical protein [Candidatus Zambryskibacteria bacterium]
MKKSTSIHALNADKGLSKFQKLLYLLLNWVNNLFPYYHVDRRIRFERLKLPNWQKEWEKTYPDSSAARKLSDLFWRTLPWQKIRDELGEIHVFDTGCGQGNYSLRLWSGIKSYTGLDTKKHPNWDVLKKEHPNFRFIESSSNNILPLIPPETNLFITQSAIEHFDEDLLFFEQICEYIKKRNKPVMQVHLFPAAATLPLYLFHGLRQYTPRTISKVTRLFGNAELSLYGLGGSASKKLQFKYFTWPVLITRRYPGPTFDVNIYEPALRKAIEYDILHPSRSPLFWALIIKS